MKNIKTYIIGFLSATCLFLFMGQTDSKEESQIGKYQVFYTEGFDKDSHPVTVYTMLNTSNGHMMSKAYFAEEWKPHYFNETIDDYIMLID